VKRNAYYWIRWLLTVPLSIIAAILIGNLLAYVWTAIITTIFYTLFPFGNKIDMSIWLYNAIRSLLQGFWFVLFMEIIAPEHKKIVTIIAFCILLILMAFTAGTMFGISTMGFYATTTSDYWVSFGASLIGGGIVFILSLLSPKENKDLGQI